MAQSEELVDFIVKDGCRLCFNGAVFDGGEKLRIPVSLAESWASYRHLEVAPAAQAPASSKKTADAQAQ